MSLEFCQTSLLESFCQNKCHPDAILTFGQTSSQAKDEVGHKTRLNFVSL